MSRTPVGIVGAGAMGLAMAGRLRDLGHPVRVRDVDPERETLAVALGCAVAPTPAALAGSCELVIVAVVDGAQTRAVVSGEQGLVRAASGDAPCTVLLCPTIAPADTEAAALALEVAGLAWLDAPMSGGPPRARDGTLCLMAAGPDVTFERWQPLLERIAARLIRVGCRAGDGARTKLVNNLLAAVNLAGAAEALALARRLGLDVARTLEVIERSSGQSWIGSDRLRRALAGDASVLARVALLAKDSTLALEMARGAGFDTPVGDAAAAAFRAVVAAGLADADDSVLWVASGAR